MSFIGKAGLPGISDEFTYTELELLDELTELEASQYKTWIDTNLQDIWLGKVVASDPYGLLDETYQLANLAKNNGYLPDFSQAKNVMKRNGTFVHIDPFA
ncbi:hypothetical protein AKG98_3535 [Moritella sp. JT01]|nr:hypothetical protein AKG98_3535 [Moritella sp. JT01]